MEHLWQDLRTSLRTLVKNPAFSLVTLGILTLGIGANTAIFTVVNSVLLEPLPFGEPDRIVEVKDAQPERDLFGIVLTAENFKDLREQNQVFSAMTAFVSNSFILTGEGEPVRLFGAEVTRGYFDVLGVRPVLGRAFLPEEEASGEPLVILSWETWKRRFGSDPSILEHPIVIDGVGHTVVGVAPQLPLPFEIWVPAPPNWDEFGRGAHIFDALARLAPGVSLEAARAEIRTLAARLEQQYPEHNAGWTTELHLLSESMIGGVRTGLVVLLVAVVLVLFIACINLASLMLVRLTARDKEFAVRTALGAGRGQLVRLTLIESVVLALASGVAGVLLARWATRLLIAVGASELPRAASIDLNGKVLVYALAISLLSVAVFALVPALQASKASPQEALKEGGRGNSGGRRGIAVRGALVLLEVALALMLLVGAGLLIRSFAALASIDAGFDPDNVLTAELALPQNAYPDGDAVRVFTRQLFQNLEDQPGIEAAGGAFPMMLTEEAFNMDYHIEGPDSGEKQRTLTRVVSPGYFTAMGIPVKSGRAFSDRDVADMPRVAIVSELAAERYWPGENPIDARITFDDPSRGDTRWWTVVGVVGDVQQDEMGREIEPELYVCFDQHAGTLINMNAQVTLVLRTRTAPEDQIDPLKSVVAALDPDLPVQNARPLENVVRQSVARPRFNMLLLTVLAGLALVLASVGVYSIVSFSVSQRRPEIGIRMAFGASRGDVLALVLTRTMWPVLIGVVVGLAASLAGSRLLASLVYGISTRDVATFVGVPAILGLVAVAACLIPARRAVRTDPMTVLREE